MASSVASRLKDVASRMAPGVRYFALSDASLVAVSKTKPIEAIQEAYEAGQRCFGENYVITDLNLGPGVGGEVSKGPTTRS